MAASGRPAFGIRIQLLGLFGLLLLTGAAVLGLDEYERQLKAAEERGLRRLD